METLQRKKKSRVPLYFMIIILAYLSGVVYLHTHEYIHFLNYRAYGLDAKMEINYLTLKGMTNAYGGNCSEGCQLSQRITDSNGYHTASLITTLWLLFIAYVITKLYLEENGRYK